jgi:hypothetical protein
MALSTSKYVSKYLNDFKPINKDIASLIINLALEVNPEFDCEIKWDQITFTLNQNWHHWIFSISEARRGVNISFHKGALLKDPRKIFKGTGSHLRTVKYEYPEMVDPSYLKTMITQAIDRQTDL